MNKRIILLGFLLMGFGIKVYAGAAVYNVEKAYVVCATDDEVNHNPGWYMPFEQELMRLKSNPPFHSLVTDDFDTVTLETSTPPGHLTVDRYYSGHGPFVVDIPGIVNRAVGEPEVQFSHEFRTTVIRELLGGKRPVSRVCRVYYVMDPVR